MAKKKLYGKDRDWPAQTVGITGLRENFSRDRTIEETYWGPSLKATFVVGYLPGHVTSNHRLYLSTQERKHISSEDTRYAHMPAFPFTIILKVAP